MKRYRQTFKEIADSLQILEVDWLVDPHAEAVISMLKSLPTKKPVTERHVVDILASDFRAASTVLRLFLGMAKDEYDRDVPALFEGKGGGGKTQFRKDPDAYVAAFVKLKLLEKINAEITGRFTGQIVFSVYLRAVGVAQERVSFVGDCWRTLYKKFSCKYSPRTKSFHVVSSSELPAKAVRRRTLQFQMLPMLKSSLR